METTLLY